MTKTELRAASTLAGVFSLRLLGLFMIYPVFAAYARHLSGATPATIGLALGIYGLSQGLLQIPFGILSDRMGRKGLIVLGLVIFATGSAIAGSATTIHGVILGRLLQGAGAVGSVILALVADLTEPEHRTQAMAMVGITIGMSFLVALVLGPLVAMFVGVPGIFWLTAALAVAAIPVVVFVVPNPRRIVVHRDAEAVPAKLAAVLRNTELLRLDFGIFALHAMLTASFLAIPQMFARTLHLGAGRDWMVYLPVLLVSVAVMVPAIVIAEKRRRMKSVLVGSVIALGLGNLLLFADGGHAPALLVALALFFSGFNVMEATLPSLVTKTAPVEAKGTATGVYSSSQFIGIFFGGVVGGWVHQRFGTPAVFLLSVGVAALWLLVAATMRPPRYLATRTLQVSDLHSRDPEALTARLLAVAGVAEAVLAPEEDAVYLRVDSATYDAAKALAAVQ